MGKYATMARMTGNPTKIKIIGKVTYEDEITIGQAARIISFLNADEADASELGDSALDTRADTKKQTSKLVDNPRDALDVSGAQTNPEKIVALGAYVIQDGGGTFKIEDVRSQFRRARETPPANFGRDLTTAINSGWIIEDDQTPGEYFLNGKMDDILAGGFAFPKGSNTGSRSKKAAPKVKASKVAMPDTLADITEFLPTLHGYPAYSKMKSEKDRLLWVTTYMRDKHKREGVTNKEVAWITARIGVGVPSNNVGSAFRSAKIPGYAYRSGIDDTIRVTDEGTAYIAGLAAEA